MAMEIAHLFIGSSPMKLRNRVSPGSISAVPLPRRMFMQLTGLGSVLTATNFPGLAATAPENDMKEPIVIRYIMEEDRLIFENSDSSNISLDLFFILWLFGDLSLQDVEAPEWRQVSRGYSLLYPSDGVFYLSEIIEGQGREAHEGDLVELNYVCRRANGYFVHSTVDQFSGESSPVKLMLDENDVIEGLKEVLVGMKAGGKRRALIPPSVGYINETLKPIPDEFGPRRSLLSHANEPLVFEVQLLKIL